jgi:CO/xanthine dehydrogenase FAD-binding subunit
MPITAECASHIGDVQVRNRGTMGGSLAHADPAADYPAAILALEVEIQTAKSGGKRVFTAEDFFVDMLTTALEPGEILTEVRVAPLAAKTGSAHLKVCNPLQVSPWSELLQWSHLMRRSRESASRGYRRCFQRFAHMTPRRH